MTLDDALKICGLIAAVIGLLVVFGALVFVIWILYLVGKAVSNAKDDLEGLSKSMDKTRAGIRAMIDNRNGDHRDVCTCGHQRGQHVAGASTFPSTPSMLKICPGFELAKRFES